CGNVITYADNKGVPVSCCGETMAELIPGTVEASAEKHIPVVTGDGKHVVVTVGAVEHPMTDAHFIKLIVIETRQGSQWKQLTPSDKPVATFELTEGDALVAAYAYCNLHGLWMA
ncbi:MAG: desulfoferrodoxin family protein, partial [Oscillospiraceae bacterium]